MPQVIRIFLTLALLPLAALATDTITVGSEIPATITLQYPAPHDRRNIQIGASSDGFLVASLDDRSGVRVQRMRDDGTLLDPLGIPLDPNLSSSSSMTVVSDGDDYLIAYDSGLPEMHLYTVRADDGLITNTMALKGAQTPAIAWNGDIYLLTFRRGSDVHAMPLDRTGRQIGGEFVVATNASDPAIAAKGNRFLIAYISGTDVMATFAESDHSDGPAFRIDTHTEEPFLPFVRVAAMGGTFLVAWNDRLPAGSMTTRAYDANGNALGEPQTVVDTNAREISLAARNDGYVITYTAGDDIAAIDIDAQGRMLGTSFLVAQDPTSESFSSVASTGTKTLAAWRNLQTIDPLNFRARSRLDARFLTPGHAGFPLLLSRAAIWQQDVTAAPLGGGYVVAFTELAAAGQSRVLMISRVSADGTPLDGAGDGIAAGIEEPVHHAISASPEPLLVWMQQAHQEFTAHVYARRIGANGFPTGDPINLGEAKRSTRVAVAWSGFVNLVAWTKPDGRLVAARVSPEGFVLDSPIEIAPANADNPSIAFDGINFFIAWNDYAVDPCPFLCPPLVRTSVVLFSQNAFFRSTPAHIAGANDSPPRAVWNGSEYTVWSYRNPNLIATRVHAAGTPIETKSVVAAPPVYFDNRLLAPVVTWDGNQYLAAYEQTLARFDKNFAPVATRTFLEGFAQLGNIVLGGTRPFVVYARRLEGPPFGDVLRAFGRFVIDAPPMRRRAAR